MKRRITGFLCLLLACCGWQAVHADGFDPTLPPEPMTKYAVTVSADPAAGAASLSGAGKYTAGSAITINQTANADYQFEYWTLNGMEWATTASINYTVGDSAAHFVAHYVSITPQIPEEQQVGLIVSADPAEGGTVSGTGVYTSGSYATISATANSNYGWSFDYWSKDGVYYGSAATFSYQVETSPAEFVAHFVYTEFDPTTPTEPIAKYRVYTSAMPSGAATTSGDGAYNLGATVNIKATTLSGWQFVHWTLNGYVYSDALSFKYTVGDSVAYFVAVYERLYTVSLQINPSTGAGTASGAGSYLAGTVVPLSVTQQVPYVFDYWTLNGERTDYAQNFSYTVGDSAALFVAHMRDTTDNTFVPVTPPEPLVYTRITATAPENYYFVSWNDGNTDNPRMVLQNEAENYTPIFAPIDFAVNINATICSNEYYLLGDQRLTLSGVYKATLQSSLGSDSVVTLNLTVNPSYLFTTVDTIHDGGSVLFGDTLLTTSGIYRKSYKTQDGCDSIYQHQVILISDSAYITTFSRPSIGGEVTGGGNYLKGSTATLDAIPSIGWHFVRWQDNLTESTRQVVVTENMQFIASFEINRYEVQFVDWNGTVLLKDSMDYGSAVIAPSDPKREGYTFNGWDKDFSNVTEDMIITAQYEKIEDPEIQITRDILDLTVDGSTIDDWTINDATFNESGSDVAKSKYAYNIKGGIQSISYVTSKPRFQFQISNSSDKANAFYIYPSRCFEYGGKNGVINILETQIGDTIKIDVAAKGSNIGNFDDPSAAYPLNATALTEDLTLPAKGSTGADSNGYTWRTLEYLSQGGDVALKEFNGGFRIRLIEVVHVKAHTPADIKSIEKNQDESVRKLFYNGQILILRGNKTYTIQGQEVK
jgi:hypothetical protein